jgi:PAT family beta-lactamase induction signal transducer AmpG
LTPDERGRANGIMAAGKYTGVVVGGQGLVWIANTVGWPAAFGAAVVLLLLPAALIVRLRESPRSSERGPRLLPLMKRSFLVRVVLLALVFAFVSDLSDYLLSPLTFPLFQRQLGYSDQWLATLATLTGLAGVAGSLLGGVLGDRMGRRRAVVIACVGVALTDFVFASGRAHWPSTAFVLAISLVGALASGMVFSASVALFMDLTNPRLGATQFQLYMSVSNLRSSAATYAGGRLADRVSPQSMFAFAGVLELIPLLMLPLLDARRAQAAFEQPSNSSDVQGIGLGPQ